MNGRKPTKRESLYINACITQVGCIACRLDGRDIENPGEWTEFHHDPDYGSTDKDCHFHGYGLCAVHHRGAFPPGCKPDRSIAVRHPQQSNAGRFSSAYGSDELLCLYAWELIPDHTKQEIGFDLSSDSIPA